MAPRSPLWLLDWKADVYSQKGEDGIIEAILSRLGNRDRWCVEFGAHDGRSFSNSRHLIEGDYSAVLIEGDAGKFRTLKSAYTSSPNITTINAFVGFTEADGLDAILRATAVPTDFDFLSIDIDGNDYHAWNAIKAYRPKVVCIEFNPTIPTGCDFVQPADPRLNQGAGISSLVALGKSKGYELACVLPWNAFFVRTDLFDRLGISDNSAQTLRSDESYLTYLFQGFDGTIFLHGNRRLLWHGLTIDERRLQLLPRPLRKYPERYSWFERRLMNVYRKFWA